MASYQQINRLLRLLAVKMIRQQINISIRLTHQSPTRTDQGRQWRTRAEHSGLKNLPPLMRGLDIHQNTDVSDTKLMLGIRVCFISSDLTANKLFPINPRAVTGPPKISLLPEVDSTSALIIEPRLILVRYTDDLGGMLAQNIDRSKDARSKPPQDCQKTKYYARADPALHHRLYSN